jgi:hypothetical protein
LYLDVLTTYKGLILGAIPAFSYHGKMATAIYSMVVGVVSLQSCNG